MTATDVRPRLTRLLSDLLCVEAEKIADSARIVEDLGADSLDAVEVAMRVEEEFGIEVSDADLEMLATVGDVVAFIERAT